MTTEYVKSKEKERTEGEYFRTIMVAGVRSGSGKTTITCALIEALKEAGEQVSACKCGPDYIDPMFHKQVLGVPSRNLDTFFTGAEETKNLLAQGRRAGELVVIEGVMGLYDGLGGTSPEGSSYHLAEVTGTPILLVVDAKGMSRSILAMIAGFLQYDTARLIWGVILNRISKGMYERIKPLIEEELGVQAIGYYPEQNELMIGSRHLGLKLPGEITDLQERIRKAAQKLRECVDLEAILSRAGTVEGTACSRSGFADCVIGVARDEAFGFYYEENLRLLRENGAALVYFSPLHDPAPPEECDALLLGGGYPELHAEELSRNITMRKAVRQAYEQGMPMVAECGGFLYLHRRIRDREGRSYEMTGILPGECADAGHLVRFGYIEVEETKSIFLPAGERIRGHEFHYYESTDNGNDCIARKPVTDRSYPCILEKEQCWFGFPHLYYPSNPAFAEAFVEKARAYRRRKRNGM